MTEATTQGRILDEMPEDIEPAFMTHLDTGRDDTENAPSNREIMDNHTDATFTVSSQTPKETAQ